MIPRPGVDLLYPIQYPQTVPAATLGQLAKKLSAYTTPEGPTFPDALAQVLDRVYALGLWADLTDERTLTVSDDYTIALPQDAETILYWLLVNGPGGPIRPLWHDYKNFGRLDSNVPTGFGLVDAGYTVGGSIPNATETNYSLRFETEAGANFGGTEKFTIDFTDGDGVRATEVLEPSGAASITTTETDIAVIHSVIWEGLVSRVRVELKNTDTDFNDDGFALLASPEGVLRTRRYRVGGGHPGDGIRVLLKLKAPFLSSDSTIVRLGNTNALKHGLLAVIAEDAADLERAQYHWGECVRVFNEELGSITDGQQFTVNLDMTGFGHVGIPNVL